MLCDLSTSRATVMGRDRTVMTITSRRHFCLFAGFAVAASNLAQQVPHVRDLLAADRYFPVVPKGKPVAAAFPGLQGQGVIQIGRIGAMQSKKITRTCVDKGPQIAVVQVLPAGRHMHFCIVSRGFDEGDFINTDHRSFSGRQ